MDRREPLTWQDWLCRLLIGAALLLSGALALAVVFALAIMAGAR